MPVPELAGITDPLEENRENNCLKNYSNHHKIKYSTYKQVWIVPDDAVPDQRSQDSPSIASFCLFSDRTVLWLDPELLRPLLSVLSICVQVQHTVLRPRDNGCWNNTTDFVSDPESNQNK